MPGLIACRRRWSIGSDDLFFPALAELTVRILWLTAVVSLFWTHESHTECLEGELLHIYLLGLQVLLAVVIALNIAIASVSAQGTIIQTRPRKSMPILLYIRASVLCIEIAWNVMGTLWSFESNTTACETLDVVVLVQIEVVASWLLLCFVALGIWMVFDPLGTTKRRGMKGNVANNEMERLHINLGTKGISKSAKVWENRFQLLCCCLRFDDNSESAYADVAEIFSSFFDDVDIVPSDIAAGLILLQDRQIKGILQRTFHTQFSQESTTSASTSSLTPLLSRNDDVLPGDWMTPDAANHFVKFAVGSYGWPLFMYQNFCTGLCLLWKDIRCCSCCRKGATVAQNDNCCNCHSSAVKKITGLRDEDIVMLSFHNRIYEVPFYVALDHGEKCIVVAIRGTLSFRDALTDLSAECEQLTIEGVPEGTTCHRGIFRAAAFVKKRLEQSGALNRAFSLHPNYQLVITGHSLGAGTASILAFLLRGQYPNLMCLAYSPPGGLLSQEASSFSKQFIMSVVFRDDFVPRLGIQTMEELKRQLLHCLVECDLPKYKVFAQGCWSALTGKNIPSNLNCSRESPGSIQPLLNNTQEESYTSCGSLHRLTSLSSRTARVHHMLPGSILHITSPEKGLYASSWVNVDHFDHLVISTTMGFDHMPSSIQHALGQLAAQLQNAGEAAPREVNQT